MAFTRQQIESARTNSADPDLKLAHAMFYDIKKRIDQGTPVNFYETYHFCDFLWVASRKKIAGINFNAYNICEDYYFLYAFKEYWGDLHGIYEHFDWMPARNPIPKSEIQQDVMKLEQIAHAWHSVVQVTNHAEALLNLISKETRQEIRSLDALPEYNVHGFLNKNFSYQFKLKFILLRSKFIYLKVKDLYDNMGVSTWILNLATRAIELDAYSMIHILNRHYPIGQKYVNTGKSDHDKSIHPNDIQSTLTQFFAIIPPGIIPKLDNNKIYFEFEGRTYVVWIVKANKSAVGVAGHIQYERIGSFYPLEEPTEVTRVKSTMVLTDLGNGFQIYSHP